MQIVTLDSAEQIAEKSLEYLKGLRVAVSGGTTFAALFRFWAPYVQERVAAGEPLHFFPVDERKVPFEDPASNWRVCYEELLLPVGLSEQKKHHTVSASEYETILRKEFGNEPVRFDQVFLGIGEDGHTASLFPGTESIKDTKSIVLDIHDSPKLPPARITLGLKPIRESGMPIAVAVGAGKAEAVKRLVEGDESLPITLAMKDHPNAVLLLDREAASLIG